MYFKRKVHCLVALIMSVLLCVTIFSACNQIEKVQTEETTITTAVTSETTGQTLSEEELNALAQDMPEIVFVMSHHYDNPNIAEDNTNILGFYITNKGEMKLYDFRKIAPDEIYDIPDVYDRLEEATCSEVHYFADDPNSSVILSKDDLSKISEEELLEYYKKLLSVNGTTIDNSSGYVLDSIIGNYSFYGIKNNDNGEREIIFLSGYSERYNYDNSDPKASELLEGLSYIFPRNLYYYPSY